MVYALYKGTSKERKTTFRELIWSGRLNVTEMLRTSSDVGLNPTPTSKFRRNNMCVASMVGDFYHEKWQQPFYTWTTTNNIEYATKEDVESLRKEVLEMKELLKRAIKYDRDNGEPDCQLEEKIATLKKIAEIVGVDIEEVFK